MIINGKSLDCRLGIQTQDRKMEGADESTELWWPPHFYPILNKLEFYPFIDGSNVLTEQYQKLNETTTILFWPWLWSSGQSACLLF